MPSNDYPGGRKGVQRPASAGRSGAHPGYPSPQLSGVDCGHSFSKFTVRGSTLAGGRYGILPCAEAVFRLILEGGPTFEKCS